MKTFEQLKAEATERGIVEGAVVRSKMHGVWTVTPFDDWTMASEGFGHSHNGMYCGPKEYPSGAWIYHPSDGWATLITPAPSKEEGLIDGDAVDLEGMPEVRDSIVAIARAYGLSVDEIALKNTEGGINPSLQWGRGSGTPALRAIVKKSAKYWWDNGFTKECSIAQFIAKIIATGSLPKPIKIGSDEVRFSTGSIKVGCTTIDNATVRSIASKLIH